MKKYLVAAALSAATVFPAAALEMGQPLPYLTLEDQHGGAHSLTGNVHTLLFTRDKGGSDVASAALDGVEQAQLEAKQVVYVADISIMPSIITSMFALPKMRKQPWLTLMDDKGDATANFPHQTNEVTMVRFENGNVADIQYFSDGAELKTALAL
ncbi:conserved hypothetical protein [Ferrimonas balearica DSM 9799]|uniref:FAD/FMN-containing dehydrogenase n=1 Tax=Ferrimonas balearica (strain DSM 9799 / CCM 4581 / KCTC 23876 / PAT) TaxID=550540 RepID=E1SML8_FERBD|nr:hypothetical protein [Ferrimonas balearica]ADN75557.1 conserved hypothetical protein [Ferrimonas balearica DSM 9799]